MRRIVDSHLDLAWNALSWKRDITLPLKELNEIDSEISNEPGRGRATVSLPEMRKGRVELCLATLMARVPYGETNVRHSSSLDFPSHDLAYAFAQGQLAYYRRLDARGEIRMIRSAEELDVYWNRNSVHDTPNAYQTVPSTGVVIAMEGSDGIVDPEQAEAWFSDGLRCASLVHYGSSAYATGTGEEGPLTDAGRELLREFERLGIILDVTHLCDTSFFQAADQFEGMMIASHQNCRALVPHQRQFSDDQIKRVIERDGVIGSAFDAWMLYSGYQRGTTPRDVVSIEAAADHIDHVCRLAGNCQHAAIGSDLDGGFGTEQCPTGLDSIADLSKLERILAERGYSNTDIDAIFHGNWLRVLRRALPNKT